MRNTQRLLLVALPIAALLAAVTLAFFSAQRALTRAADTTHTAAQLPFTLTSLDLASLATPAFEPVATPTPFTCGAFFAGNLYLAGPTGLSIYAPDGTLRRTLRTGLELPVSPIVAITPARLRNSSDPRLLLATAGAGLLLLDTPPNAPPTLHQLLPTTPDLRDLTTLLPLSTGDLLLGTRHHGVLLFNGASLTPLRFTLEGNDPTHLEVTALAAPDSASILIGTRTTGLFYLHGGTVAHADTTSGLPDNQIETMAITPGKAFAGTPLGIAQFNLTSAADPSSLHPARILAPGLFTHALALNAAATELTAGTLDQGVQELPLTPNLRPHLRNMSISLPTLNESHQRIDQFLTPPDQSGPLYALADGTLLLRNASGWTPALPPAPTPVTLTDRDISALAFDPTGRLYVGFFDRGLDILAPENQTTPIRHLEDDHLFCINRLVLDPTRQTIAAATANGLILFDAQATPRQVLTRRDGLISDHISDIAFTRTGPASETVLATPAGLTFLTSTGPESLYAFQGLVNNHVYALAANPQTDRLLAGTLGGLSLLENGTVRRNFTATDSGLKHNWITALAPLPDGSTLLGTYGAGLLRLTSDRDGTTRFSPIDLPAATPRDLVINPNAILATPTHLYAGTLDNGLLVYTTSTARWSNITHGLPSPNVTAFATRDGILYIGTDNGLVRIPETRLQ